LKPRKQKQMQNQTKQKTCEEVIWGDGECNGGQAKERDIEITPGCVDSVGCVLRRCDTMRVTICKAWVAI